MSNFYYCIKYALQNENLNFIRNKFNHSQKSLWSSTKEPKNYALKRNFPITQKDIITFPWYIYAPTWINFQQIYFKATSKFLFLRRKRQKQFWGGGGEQKYIKKTFCGLNLLFCWFEVEKSFLNFRRKKIYVGWRRKKCNGREKLRRKPKKKKKKKREIYHVSVIWRISCKILKMEIEMRELTPLSLYPL